MFHGYLQIYYHIHHLDFRLSSLGYVVFSSLKYTSPGANMFDIEELLRLPHGQVKLIL